MFPTILSALQGKTSVRHLFEGLFAWVLNHLVHSDETCDYR
jgi:hypothetical protein